MRNIYKYRTTWSPRVTHQSDSDYKPEQQATKEAQDCPQPQALIQVPDYLYSRGAQTQQQKRGKKTFK